MSQEIVTESLDLKTHLYGCISRKMKLGPAKWPFHDLLWVHQGCITIKFSDLGSNITLNAPSGILIMPNTAFTGESASAISSVSICHFSYDGPSATKFVVTKLFQIYTKYIHKIKLGWQCIWQTVTTPMIFHVGVDYYTQY